MQSLTWRRQRLTTKFIVGVLCALIPIAALLGLLGEQRRERDLQAALESLTRTAEAAAIIVDDALDDGERMTRTLATAASMRTHDPAVILPRLREIQAIHPIYANLSVADASGVVVGSVGGEVPAGGMLSPGQRDVLDRVAGSPAAVLFVVPDPASAEALDAGVMAPIRGEDGALLGVVIASFDLRSIYERLRDLRTAPDQGLALLDTNGRLILALSPTGAVAEGLTWEQRERGSVPEVQAALRGQVAVSPSFVSPIVGGDRLGVWVPARRHGWVTSVSWPVDSALAPSRAAERNELLIFATIVLVVVIGAALSVRLAMWPLRRLAEHTTRLGEGDFEPVQGIESNDEIGQLADAFNRMGQRLQRTLGDLHHERASLESVLQQLPVGVVVVSADDGAVVRTNGLSERLLVHTSMRQGYYDPADPSFGFHLDGRPYRPEERALARALRNGETIRAEEVLLRLPGQPDIVISVSAAPIRDPDGRIVSAVQTIEDVTERRLADARLRQQEEILRALIEQFPAVISVVDRQYRIVMRGGQQSFIRRAPGQDLAGLDLRTVLPADDFESFHRLAERAFAGEVVTFEGVRDGRTLRGTISPLRGASGEIDGVLNVAFDVTDERAREERATRDEKLRALGQMAGGIAHDLNQALTLVAGYGELAREALNCEDPNPNPACEMIRIMERAAYDGGATVRRLLTFVRGGEQEQFQAVDVGGLLHEVEQLTAPRWRDATRVDGNRVTLRIDAAPGLAVFGSQSALREMLTNLVFNAADAMPEGGSIVLAARPADDHVLIDVADTGTGMSPEIKARVFEPFFTTKGQAGSGLGLAMVFGIVQRHQGQIDIASDEGRGTTIHLTLPAADRARLAPTLEAVADEMPTCRILVVDDEPRLATLLVGLLRHEGHVGITAPSAEEALERLASEQFDLVITDLSMGEGMNGWELAAAIAASPDPIPVVLATGWGAGIDEDEARNRNVSGVVAKPYRRADIHAVIARVLAGRADGQ